MNNAIRSIRASITEVDRAILSLLAARLKLVSLVGEAKAQQGLPIIDPAREVEVLSLVREEAAKRGLSPDIASELYSLIISYSRCAQVTCPEKLRVAIYGYGGMAETLARHFARGGCWVVITGRRLERAERLAKKLGVEHMGEEDAMEWADLLVYAVPGSVVPSLLEKHAGLIRESMLVTDISSVKKPLVERVKPLVEKRGFEYASLHPLFGPLDCPAGETIAVIPVKLGYWRERLERLLEGLGLRYEYIDADTHDKIMAANQVLHHAALQAFTKAYKMLLEELGVPMGKAKLLTTYSLRKTLEVVERIGRLERVVEEIRAENPYSRLALDALRRAVEELSESSRG